MSDESALISVPEHTIQGGPTPFGFAEFVRFLVDGDQRFQQNADGLRAASRILSGLVTAKGHLELAVADHAILKQAAEQPTCGYPGLSDGKQVVRHLGRECLPFIDAIADAEIGVVDA